MKVAKCLSRGVVAALAISGLVAALTTSGAAAAAPPASRVSIVCPGATGIMPCCPVPVGGMRPRPAAVTCCPVPTGTGCCSTPTPCCVPTCVAPALSIGTTPDPVTEGHQTTITGRLTGTTTASGQTVTLWQRLAGQSAFTAVAHTQTDASGAFTFHRSVRTNVAWYAKTGSVASATVNESVRARVGLRASKLRPAMGSRLSLSGTVAPSHAGERVALELQRAARWVTVARPMLSSSSRFAVAWTMRTRATERFRVVLRADARNARSVSRVVAITAR